MCHRDSHTNRLREKLRMEAIIRKTSRDDEQAFIHFSLELSHFNRQHHPQKDDFDAVLHARAERASILFNSEDPNQLILMAKLGDAYVGYALAYVSYPDATNDNGTELCGLLDEVYIDPNARGHGIGRHLVDECLVWMRDQGANRVKLQMYEWNEHARRLYEKMGFLQYAVSFHKFLK
jgi:GNAT superfamily N-acetyltransferase